MISYFEHMKIAGQKIPPSTPLFNWNFTTQQRHNNSSNNTTRIEDYSTKV